MKVLHVIDSGGLYGAERVLLALMDALRDKGVDCALASIAEPRQPEKPLEAVAREENFEVRRHAMAAGPDRRAARALVAWAKDAGFDLLHTHGYKANALVAGMPRARRGIPAVATLHGWTSVRRISRMGVYETAERFMLRNADRIVAVSDAMVERWQLRRRYGGRLRMIHNGIPAGRKDGNLEAAVLPAEVAAFIRGRPAIFAAGRLSPEKGFDVLVAALADLTARGVGARLVLVGEGGQRAALQAQAKALNVTNQFMMPGYLKNASSLMPHFNAVAIPSRSEGLPIVLLEALFAGVPVVATTVGEMPVVLEDCGASEAVPADDAAALGVALKSVLGGAMDASTLERVASRARDHYSAEAMGDRYLALYKELEVAA